MLEIIIQMVLVVLMLMSFYQISLYFSDVLLSIYNLYKTNTLFSHISIGST